MEVFQNRIKWILFRAPAAPETVGRGAINPTGPAPEIYGIPKQIIKMLGISHPGDENVRNFFAGIFFAQAGSVGGLMVGASHPASPDPGGDMLSRRESLGGNRCGAGSCPPSSHIRLPPIGKCTALVSFSFVPRTPTLQDTQ